MTQGNPKNQDQSPETDERIIFAQLESEVNAIAFSPDGRKVIAGLANGQLHLLDLITGKAISKPFEGHADAILSVAFSPDGQTIVSGSDDGTLRLWDLRGNSLGKPFEGNTGNVYSVAFSPDGQFIVSGSGYEFDPLDNKDKAIRLWNLQGNQIAEPFEGHTSKISSVAFSPDGQSIASGSNDKTIRLWDLQGSQIGKPFEGHTGNVYSVAFSPDGQSIVSGSKDKTIRLWDLRGNQIGKPFEGHTGNVYSVSFSPDGQSIVSGSYDKTIRLWDLRGNPIRKPFEGHTNLVNSVAFSPDGQSIVSGSYDKTIRLWDLHENLIYRIYETQTDKGWSVAFSLDGQFIISILGKGIKLWDLKGNQIGKLFEGHTNLVNSVAFSPDGQSIVSGSDDKTIRLWDLRGNQIGKPFEGHTGNVYSVAFSPDGQSIVSGSDDKTIRLWDLQGNPIRKPFEGHTNLVYSVSFSPDGQSIISGSYDYTIRLWDLQGNEIGKPFEGHTNPVNSVIFSPDSQSIVSGSWDKTIRLWDLQGNQIGKPFKGHTSKISSVAFSPDGQFIVSGSKDKTIRLWDLRGNQIGKPFKGHTNTISSVAFSPDGQFIASGSDDKTIRLWFTPKAQVVKPIRNLSARLRQITVPQTINNDGPEGDDQLDVKDEMEALARVLMLRNLQPPLAVGILGSWGSGKSFGMHLIRSKVNKIRSQSIDELQAWGDPEHPAHRFLQSSEVGHIYQIHFSAWTYAKSNLWASLMQEIFFELNRQITLEKQLGTILSQLQFRDANASKISTSSQSREKLSRFLIERLIYQPWDKFRKFINNYIILPAIYFVLQGIRIIDLVIIQILWHIIFLILFTTSFAISLVATIIKDIFNLSLLNNFSNLIFNLLKRNVYLKQIKYYIIDYDFNSLSILEIIVESILFFLFAGFPRRLKDRNRVWQQRLNRWQQDKSSSEQTYIQKDSSSHNSDYYGEVLRKGGEFWQFLYLMNEDERNTLLRNKLNADISKEFQNLTSDKEISNYLWQTLNQIKLKEKDQLQETEEELQAKEKELQRSLKNAELEVERQLSRKAITAYWKPLVDMLLRQKFNDKQIEEFAASGKTLAKLRETIQSWPGLIALFVIGIIIFFTFQPEVLPSLWKQLVNFLKDKQLLEEGKRWITILGSTFIALIPTIKVLGDYLSAVNKERAKIRSERDIILEQERSKTDKIAQDLAQLKQKVDQQRQSIGITANYSSLMDFVSGRLENQAYGEHLGLMKQAQQDLKDLSRHLTVGEHNREKLKKLFPRGPARVIIYIDDLDRCPPKRVVEVLETVQLLLKTELFIVVLAIDDRYIARALEEVYSGVLKRKGKPSGIDYLEKIIQIPYRMRPISPATVEQYLKSQVQGQVKPETEQTDLKDKSDHSQSKNSQPSITETAIPSESKDESEFSNADQQTSKSGSDIATTSNLHPQNAAEIKYSNPIQTPKNPTPVQPQVDDTPEINPKKISPKSPSTPNNQNSTSSNQNFKYLQTEVKVTDFDEDLFKILVECCKPVDITPRTAKRLINIAKILQIIWSKSEQQTTNDEKRIIIAFLALSGRYPNFMRYLFDEIDVLLEECTFDKETHKFVTDEPKLENVDFQKEILSNIETQIPTNDHYAQREWRRFISDLQRIFSPYNQFSKFTMSRRAFELTLSFCFVGDIGYDPDDYLPSAPINEEFTPGNGAFTTGKDQDTY